MKRTIVLFALFSFGLSCNQKVENREKKHSKPLVVFQPLELKDSSTLVYLKDSIKKFYPVDVIIAKEKKFPETVFYKPRNRYRADRIIHWLRMNIADSVRLIVGITSKDISSTKNNVYDYGVMGLGYQPGHACVVSSYRFIKTAKSKQQYQQRLFKVVAHEMGHNFGLLHCPNQSCIMVDAEGKMKLDEEKGLCTDCKKKLKI